MLLLVSCKKETDHSDECAISLINSLLVVHRIHWRKWGQEWKRLFICLVVKVMNVMWGRGLHELLPLHVSDLKLKYDADVQCLFPPSESSLFTHVFCFVFYLKHQIVPWIQEEWPKWVLNPANLSKTFLLVFPCFLWLSFCQQMVLQSLCTASTGELHNICSPGLPQTCAAH